MLSSHRKKANYRLIENLSKEKRINSTPSRVGKNYFVKYHWQNKKAESALQTISELKSTHQDDQFNGADSIASLSVAWGGEVNRENSYTHKMTVALLERFWIEVSKLGDEVKFELETLRISEVHQKIHKILEPEKDRLATLPRESRRFELIKLILCQDSALKDICKIELDRIFSWLLRTKRKCKQEDGGNQKKIINTQSRINRLVFLWRNVTDVKKISTIDLSNLLKKGLEKGLPYKIDRKTILRLLNDLEELGFVTIHKFRISAESDNSTNTLTRIMAVDSFEKISVDDIKDDPSLKNPFFKRSGELPMSLAFLKKDSRMECTSSHSESNYEGDSIKGGVYSSKDLKKVDHPHKDPKLTREELKKIKIVTRFIKRFELQIKKHALIKLRGNKLNRIISGYVDKYETGVSITENKLRRMFDIMPFGEITDEVFLKDQPSLTNKMSLFEANKEILDNEETIYDDDEFCEFSLSFGKELDQDNLKDLSCSNNQIVAEDDLYIKEKVEKKLDGAIRALRKSAAFDINFFDSDIDLKMFKVLRIQGLIHEQRVLDPKSQEGGFNNFKLST